MAAEARVAEKDSEASGTIESIVLVTIPAALIYFIGWAYLHYYLGAFAIDLSELELGVETVLIYAAPPLFSLWSAHKLMLGLGLFMLLVVSALLVWRIQRHHGSSSGGAAGHVAATAPVRPEYVWLPTVTFVLKGLWAFVVMVGLAFLLTPALRDFANGKARVTWQDDSMPIEVTVEAPEKPDPLHDNYRTCQEARHLHLVFSDKDRYFLLCTSAIDPDRGAVYEVRREDSVLASVRYVRSPGK